MVLSTLMLATLLPGFLRAKLARYGFGQITLQIMKENP